MKTLNRCIWAAAAAALAFWVGLALAQQANIISIPTTSRPTDGATCPQGINMMAVVLVDPLEFYWCDHSGSGNWELTAVASADTLGGFDVSEFAIRAQNENITGDWDFLGDVTFGEDGDESTVCIESDTVGPGTVTWCFNPSGAGDMTISATGTPGTGLSITEATFIGELLTLTSGLTVTSGSITTPLTDCDTIDTDSSGVMACGTDDVAIGLAATTDITDPVHGGSCTAGEDPQYVEGAQRSHLCRCQDDDGDSTAYWDCRAGVQYVDVDLDGTVETTDYGCLWLSRPYDDTPSIGDVFKGFCGLCIGAGDCSRVTNPAWGNFEYSDSVPSTTTPNEANVTQGFHNSYMRAGTSGEWLIFSNGQGYDSDTDGTVDRCYYKTSATGDFSQIGYAPPCGQPFEWPDGSQHVTSMTWRYQDLDNDGSLHDEPALRVAAFMHNENGGGFLGERFGNFFNEDITSGTPPLCLGGDGAKYTGSTPRTLDMRCSDGTLATGPEDVIFDQGDVEFDNNILLDGAFVGGAGNSPFRVDRDNDGTRNVRFTNGLSGGLDFLYDGDDSGATDFQVRMQSMGQSPFNPTVIMGAGTGANPYDGPSPGEDRVWFPRLITSNIHALPDNDYDGTTDSVARIFLGGPCGTMSAFACSTKATHVVISEVTGETVDTGVISRLSFGNPGGYGSWTLAADYVQFDLNSVTTAELEVNVDANGTGGASEALVFGEGYIYVARRSSDPSCSSSTEGQLWFNTTASEFRVCADNDGDSTYNVYQLDMTTPP